MNKHCQCCAPQRLICDAFSRNRTYSICDAHGICKGVQHHADDGTYLRPVPLCKEMDLPDLVKLIQCRQRVEGGGWCPERPIVFAHWPGQDPIAMCLSHAGRAHKVAEFMGFTLLFSEFSVPVAECLAQGLPVQVSITVHLNKTGIK